LRLQAEFDNARKRMLKEQEIFEERANAKLLTELVDVIDDFERALSSVEQETEIERMKSGIEMIYKRAQEILKSHGLEEMKAVGQTFDPTRHEAVGFVETTEQPESTVVEELRRGYLFKGTVVRPATVKVAVKNKENQEVS